MKPKKFTMLTLKSALGSEYLKVNNGIIVNYMISPDSFERGRFKTLRNICLRLWGLNHTPSWYRVGSMVSIQASFVNPRNSVVAQNVGFP